MDFGFRELIVILIIVFLLFGAKRIPEIMRSFGQGVKEFKKSAKEISDDEDASKTTSSQPPQKDAPPSDKQA